MHNYYLLSYILLMVLLDSSVKSNHLFEQHLLESVLVLALVYLKDVWHFHSCPVSAQNYPHPNFTCLIDAHVLQQRLSVCFWTEQID